MIAGDHAVLLAVLLDLPRDSCDEVLFRALDERIRRCGVTPRLVKIVNAIGGTDAMLQDAAHDSELAARERAKLPPRLDGLYDR